MSRTPRTVKMNTADQLKALLACSTEEEVQKLVDEYPDLAWQSAHMAKLNAVINLGSQLSPARFKAEAFRPQFRQEKADLLRKVMENGKTIYCYGEPGTGRSEWFKTFFGADMRVCSNPIVGFDDIFRGLNKWPKIIQWYISAKNFMKEELLNFVSPGEVPWLHAMKIPESYYIPKTVYRVINTDFEPKELMTLMGSTPDEIDKFMASIYVWKVEKSTLFLLETIKKGVTAYIQGPIGSGSSGCVPIQLTAEQMQAIASAAGKRKRT